MFFFYPLIYFPFLISTFISFFRLLFPFSHKLRSDLGFLPSFFLSRFQSQCPSKNVNVNESEHYNSVCIQILNKWPCAFIYAPKLFCPFESLFENAGLLIWTLEYLSNASIFITAWKCTIGPRGPLHDPVFN